MLLILQIREICDVTSFLLAKEETNRRAQSYTRRTTDRYCSRWPTERRVTRKEELLVHSLAQHIIKPSARNISF